MIERREHLCFAAKPREPIGIAGQQVRQHLQRDLAVQFRIAGAVDLAHAAGADGGNNLVWAQPGPGSKRHKEWSEYMPHGRRLGQRQEVGRHVTQARALGH